jgi:putative transcriptional regulator
VAPALLFCHAEIDRSQCCTENRRAFKMFDQASEFVRSLRRELKMTQEEFAHELGITVGTVNRWEKGRFRPSKLARATLLEFAERHGRSIQGFTNKGGNHEPTVAHE